MIKKGEKGGQVAIFIIIAILIVALAVLLYLYWPKLFPSTSPQTKNPSQYIQDCMEETIKQAVDNVSMQGGSINPLAYYTYDNNRIEYLCYTNQYYRPCVVQQPMLAQHIQSEILNEIKDATVTCFNSMKDSYDTQGYTTDMKTGDTIVELLPDKIVTTFGYELTLTKGETSKYNDFKIVLDNNLYRMVSIANSIIGYETLYGGTDITSYMDYYHDLKVEKLKQVDGTTIYILTDRNSKDVFQFASRSYVFPPGIVG